MVAFDRDAEDGSRVDKALGRQSAAQEPPLRVAPTPVTQAPSAHTLRTQASAARTLLGLQRSVGNRATAAMMCRVNPPEVGRVETVAVQAPRSDGHSRDAAASMPSGSLWAAPPAAARPNPFAAADGQLIVQRHKTSDGTGTAKVDFESSSYTASIAKALDLTKDATSVRMASSPYNASGTVSATGDKAAVKNYQVGFLQTMYEGSFDAYYTSAAHPPGKGAVKTNWVVSTLPIRDGLDAAVVPWYGTNTVKDFGEAATSSKSTSMYDKPAYSANWSVGSGADTQWLTKTAGRNSFRSWIAVYNTVAKNTIWMDHSDWAVTYGSTVVADPKNPAGSTITPTGSGTVSTGAGPGSKTPVMSSPVANNAFVFSSGTW